MPSKTEKQRRAMEAAAAGHSTIGIPQRVAKEFVAADHAKAHGKSEKSEKKTETKKPKY
jgi:hypothetical protein